MKKKFLCAVGACFACFAAVAAEGGFKRSVTEANDPVDRPRRAGKTYFFCERQLYTPALNYQHRYIDRPLFTDSSLRNRPGGPAKAGFYRDMEILRWSGFDGFGSIAYPGVYHQQLAWFKTDPPPEGYSQFPVLWNFYRKADRADPHYATLRKMIVAAAKSPYAARLDGKPLVWLWGNALDRQCDWLKLLKSDPEIPPFACFPILPFYPMYGSFNSPKHPGVCSPEACERFKRELAEMLTWADGVQLWMCERYLTWNGDHGRHILKTDLCRKYLFPLTLEVMARPEFKDKYLGAFIEQAYINHKNGPVSDQYGTEMLRSFLDEAMLQNPDVLVGFEWNEANENTSFQPTVSSAGAVARVIGYYRSKINREPLKPRPGDDVSVPNLILSTRQTMRVGEAYHAELLYVPDGTAPAPFQARVVLRDASGRKLRELPWEKLPTAKLTAFSYRLPSEDFASELAVTPEIEVKTGEDVKVYRGFDSTRFEPAVCINYLYCRQPLREMIAPAEESFSVKPLGGGRYAVKGAFASEEELSSLEVMENTHEVAAAENGDLFDRVRDSHFVVSLDSLHGLGNREAMVGIAGVDGWKLRRAEVPYDPVRVVDAANPRKVKINLASKRVMLLSVPKDACGKAKVRISISGMDIVKEVSIAEVLRRGVYATTWPAHLRLEVTRMDKLGDYPAPLGTRSAGIDTVLDALSGAPVYQLRAISKSGKVWRSRPIVPDRHDGRKRRVECYSCYHRKWVDAEIDEDRLVDVKYDFSDASRGEYLPAVGGDQRWDVSLGGGWGSDGPMWWEFIKTGPKLTADFVTTVPDRVKADDGSPALRFDGKGQYLAFPQELIPCDSGYKLGFEIRPDADESYVLIRQMHSVNEECGLRLVSDKGELVISFFGRSLVPRHFRTGLKLRAGEWNRVVIEKTGRTLSCSLDGVKKTYPYNRLALHFKTAIFGANIMPGRELPEGIKPFKGLMRALQVRHGIDVAPPPLKVALTFDDNLRDHLLIAAPELEKRGWRGLFAVITDKVGKDGYQLTWDDIRELKKRGHIIANHTKSHDLKRGGLGGIARLGKLDEVRSEIALASEVMKRELGESPEYLCLPGSAYTEDVGRIAEELGIKPMLLKRDCFGADAVDVAGRIRKLRREGRKSADFLVHGICREGKGWMPFKSKAAFIKYLDDIKSAEKAGLVKVVSYSELED